MCFGNSLIIWATALSYESRFDIHLDCRLLLFVADCNANGKAYFAVQIY